MCLQIDITQKQIQSWMRRKETRCHNFINSRSLALPDNRNVVLSIHVPGVVLKSLKINGVGARTIYL